MLVLAALLANAPPPPGHCLDVRSGDAPITLQGRVVRRPFTDNMGRPEPSYILILDRPTCADDGGNFADPRTRIGRVHLVPTELRFWPRIRATLGHRIRIRGRAYAAMTAHHHAPLVVEVNTITMLRR